MTERTGGEKLAEFTPERWEVAIEDAAEVVALLLDRGQAAFSGLGNLWKERPGLMSALMAAGAGAVFGTIIAGQRRRQRLKASRGAVAQATAVAQAAARRLAEQREVAGRAISQQRESAGRAIGRNGFAITGRRRRFADAGIGARYALQLVPVVVTVLKNPLVRALLWRYARRAIRR